MSLTKWITTKLQHMKEGAYFSQPTQDHSTVLCSRQKMMYNGMYAVLNLTAEPSWAQLTSVPRWPWLPTVPCGRRGALNQFSGTAFYWSLPFGTPAPKQHHPATMASEKVLNDTSHLTSHAGEQRKKLLLTVLCHTLMMELLFEETRVMLYVNTCRYCMKLSLTPWPPSFSSSFFLHLFAL